MVSENRRDLRYRAQLATTLTLGHDTREILTDDVSFRGAFLRTDLVTGPRKLVRVSFILPDHQDVSGHAMVVHVLPEGEGSDGAVRPAGIGIEFFGEISGRKRWDAFIQELTKDPALRTG
jgi:hypothetical protein